MILANLSPLANHLWLSTLCAAVAWLLAMALRRNRAAVRYWIWLAASAKFLIPFALLVGARESTWMANGAGAIPAKPPTKCCGRRPASCCGHCWRSGLSSPFAARLKRCRCMNWSSPRAGQNSRRRIRIAMRALQPVTASGSDAEWFLGRAGAG